jgi:hypothetical protein
MRSFKFTTTSIWFVGEVQKLEKSFNRVRFPEHSDGHGAGSRETSWNVGLFRLVQGKFM